MQPRLRLAHVTIAARDLEPMVAFYCDVLGFSVTDRGEPVPGMGDMVFISQDPDAHHQIALVTTPEPPARGFTMADHMAFRVESLDELREVGRRLDAAGVAGVIPISHGNAWSLYFTDPEGNGLEVFVDSPFHVPQPYANGADFSQTDDGLAAATKAKLEALEGFTSFDDWRAAHAQRLAGA